jgi:hypothetical protein
MGYYNFREYLKQKYGSVENAHQEIHEYIKIVNGKEIVIDEETYNNTPEVERKKITKYQFEEIENEKRKQIKLIRKEFVPEIEKELKEIFNND